MLTRLAKSRTYGFKWKNLLQYIRSRSVSLGRYLLQPLASTPASMLKHIHTHVTTYTLKVAYKHTFSHKGIQIELSMWTDNMFQLQASLYKQKDLAAVYSADTMAIVL